MNLNEYSEGRTCSICDHPITDSNPDGIGFQCRSIWNQARASAFYKFNPYASHVKKIDIIVPVFIELHKDVKFRSNFKKSFFNSIHGAWNTHKRISSKQLEICLDWISYKLTYNEMRIIQQEIEESKKIYKTWTPQTKEEKQYLNDCIGRLYGKLKKTN